MADHGIVGKIGPEPTARITEATGWREPYREFEVTDHTGRRHGLIQWLSSDDLGDGFGIAIHEVYLAATQAREAPSAPSDGAPAPTPLTVPRLA